MSGWFNVDKAGLARLLERRGKAWALFELVQNAWDTGAATVSVSIEPLPSAPYAKIRVLDDSPDGWADLDHAFTMFADSSRAHDPDKRGRFNLGEKLVLACSRYASIATMNGTITFDPKGRSVSGKSTVEGTEFVAEIRMTRDELDEVCEAAMRLITPAKTTTTFNGDTLIRPEPVAVFEAKLPTEFAVDGVMRRTTRKAFVEVFETSGQGEILEMGIPVCEIELPWRITFINRSLRTWSVIR